MESKKTLRKNTFKTEKLFQQIENTRVAENNNSLKVTARIKAVNPLCVGIALNGVFDIVYSEIDSTPNQETYYIKRGKSVLGCMKFTF